MLGVELHFDHPGGDPDLPGDPPVHRVEESLEVALPRRRRRDRGQSREFVHERRLAGLRQAR
jgi:hypothetical protein